MTARRTVSSAQTAPISIRLDELDRADGSSRFVFGDVGALASVSGPIEARIAVEQPNRAALEVVVRPLNGVPATEARAFAAALSAILSPTLLLNAHPRTLIQVVVQSLAPPSAPLAIVQAAMINAVSLALLRAGSVPMRSVVCAAPSADGRACFAFDGEGCLLWSRSPGEPDVRTARNTVQEVRAAMRAALAGENDVKMETD